MMSFGSVGGPILEPPEGARRLAGAFGAVFRPRAGHGSLLMVHDGALTAAPSGDRCRRMLVRRHYRAYGGRLGESRRGGRHPCCPAVPCRRRPRDALDCWCPGMVDRGPVAADVAGRIMRHCDSAHFALVAMTTDTGRVSEISQRRPSLWEVVLAIWNRRRVSADTPTRFAASFCETPFFMSFRAASSRSERLKGWDEAVLGRSAALACPRACERLLPPASPRAIRIRYSSA